MTWETASDSTYPKARRKELYRRLAQAVGRSDPTLPAFEELQQRLGLFEQSYLGMRAIPVDRIVGSVARTSDFDRDFLPKSDHVRQRWEQLERAFPSGNFPPIVVYEVGQVYFVIDGHHRVAIAKQSGMEYLDAEITLVKTPYEITPEVDFAEIIYLQAKRRFMEESGLARVRPDAAIEFTRLEGFLEALDHVKVHGYNLTMDCGEFVSRERIAADWYDNIYLPRVRDIRAEGLLQVLPKATEADLFLWARRRFYNGTAYQLNLSFQDAVRDATEEEGRKLGARARAAVGRMTGKDDPGPDEAEAEAEAD